MSSHNIVVNRGIRMKLYPHSSAKKLVFSSLKIFVRTMFSLEICQILRSLTIFGERVAALINQQPSTLEWWITEDVFIHRRHWMALCDSVMRIVPFATIKVFDTFQQMSLNEHRSERDIHKSTARVAIKIF